MTGPPPDAAIIGGGIVGAATAAFLAEAGLRVVLYEREGLAAGASGANSGVIQRPFDPALFSLYGATIGLYRTLTDADAGFRLADEPAGMLLVSQKAEVVRRLAEALRAAMPELRPEAVDGPALAELEPLLAPDVVACRLQIGYPVPPSASTYAYVTVAERHGATIRLGRAATPVVRSGRAVGCLVDGRLEPAGAVIVAAGPWTPALLDPSGRWRPIRPLWGVVVETRLAAAPRHVLEEAEMDEALGTRDIAIQAGAAPPEPGTTPEFSLVTAAGTSAVGSTFLDREPDPAAWTVPILARATRFVPSLATAPIRSVRACARPLSADGRPLIGALPGVDGLFICAGHGPWGISTGPASARLVADLVLGRPSEIPHDLAAARFEALPR